MTVSLPLTSFTLPALDEVLAGVHVVALPLKVRFRGVDVRETALIQGPSGWGEFAPFIEYEPSEAAAWLACALEAAWLPYPQPVRTHIPLNATVPAVSRGQVEGVLARYSGEIREVKIKVAEAGLAFEESLAQDLDRVREVRRVLPQARLKVDANGGWTESQAVRALMELEECELLYAEQPTPGIEGLARVRERLRQHGNSVLIAADEAVRKADDPLTVARLGAADLMVIKAAPLGGVRRSLEIVRQAGLPVVVSSALESSVGIRTGAALAAALPELPYGCGLGTVSLMEKDVLSVSLVAENGYLPVREITPDHRLLSNLAAPLDRQQWWREHIIRCYHILEAEAQARAVDVSE